MAPTIRDIDVHDTTSTSLTANLVCRVLFAFIANIACSVPFRQLWKNGEFAAVVFIGVVMLLNFDCIVNALIWQNDDVEKWWHGKGFCDFHNYWYYPVSTLYASSNMAIMRNLSIQVGLLRAHPLSTKEKRMRNIVQALIMFPVPLIQMAWVYPVSSTRYFITTLVGCGFRADQSWPTLVFFHLPPPAFALGSAYYAVLTWFRYRQVRKTTGAALNGDSMSTSVAAARSQRAQRKLYLMTLSILVPYLPVIWAFLALALVDFFPMNAFDFARIHGGTGPYPWDTILLIPSYMISFPYMNANYVPILTAIPMFWYFGMTKEGINMYRKAALFIGLGKLFSKLNEEYDPDRRTGSGLSGSRPWESASGRSKSRTIRHKGSMSTATRVPTTTSSCSTELKSNPNSPTTFQEMNFLTVQEHGQYPTAMSAPADSGPQSATISSPNGGERPEGSPFLARLQRSLHSPATWLSKNSSHKAVRSEAARPIQAIPTIHAGLQYPTGTRTESSGCQCAFTPNRSRVCTQVWSGDESGLHDYHAQSAAERGNLGVVVETEIATSSNSPTNREKTALGGYAI